MQKKNFPKIVLGILFIILAFFIILALFVKKEYGDSEEILLEERQTQPVDTGIVTLFFVGDTMLGRVVENIIERNSFAYLFENVHEIFANDVTIGNFEGIVPNTHTYTKPYTFLFSIREEYMSNLSQLGFDVISLANNHSYDFGKRALENTRFLCQKNSLMCVGDPHNEKSEMVSIQEVGGYKIGYLFLNAVGKSIEHEAYQEVLQNLKEETDMVIAFVHWGEEYELQHNTIQQALAHELIDTGVDVIIGHHPHVVQDIEVYKGKPIFYSLGNFIFDQYFSDDVQEGLGVKIYFDGHTPQYELVGFTSVGSPSQPRFMHTHESEELFNRILENTGHFNVQKAVKGNVAL